MVAYSFQARFRAPILAGTKDQTIRAERKRHARPGEELQLYTGMRTRQCAIIGRATCEAVMPITLDFGVRLITTTRCVTGNPASLDLFARRDGFADWRDMTAFWAEQHPNMRVFSGVLIRWEALTDAQAMPDEDAWQVTRADCHARGRVARVLRKPCVAPRDMNAWQSRAWCDGWCEQDVQFADPTDPHA